MRLPVPPPSRGDSFGELRRGPEVRNFRLGLPCSPLTGACSGMPRARLSTTPRETSASPEARTGYRSSSVEARPEQRPAESCPRPLASHPSNETRKRRIQPKLAAKSPIRERPWLDSDPPTTPRLIPGQLLPSQPRLVNEPAEPAAGESAATEIFECAARRRARGSSSGPPAPRPFRTACEPTRSRDR